MELVLACAVGAAFGAVLWSVFIHGMDPMAIWLLKPFGTPGAFSYALALAFSVIFLLGSFLGCMFALADWLGHRYATGDAKTLRGTLLVSSCAGYLLLPVSVRLESWCLKRLGGLKKRSSR
jgi:hypothetical protein